MPQWLGKNLYPTLSVFENIDFFGRLFALGQAERKAHIDELLKSTDLTAFRDRLAGELVRHISIWQPEGVMLSCASVFIRQ